MHEYKNKSILLVEDETIIALTQSAVLKKSGFNVKSVLSGEKAVALLESGETFDLILMDIDLGKGMSGTEAAEKILSMCDIPILFLSSHTEPEIVEKTEGITSYGYVVKNSGDTVLLASIRMAFRLFEEKVKVQRHKEQFQKLNEELEATNEELTAAMEELEAANEELLQSQGEILLSEEKFRRLFMSSNDGICLHEIIYNEKGDAADYRIIDVNPVYEDITGLKRIDVAGKSASGVYGTGAPPYLDVYSEVAETEVPKTFDVYFEPMDRHFHISVFSPGKGMFATAFQDITGKRRAEIQLRESEERYRALAEGSPNAIVVHQNGIIQYINETGLLLFGADSKEEITGTEFILRVHEDFREIVAERINKVSENLEKVPVFEEVMYRLNGEEFYAEVLSVPFWHNEELAVQTIIQDISERKKIELSLYEQRKILDTVINAIPAPVFFKDRDGRYTGCNRAFLDYLGYEREDVIGKTVYEIAPAELSEKYHSADLHLMDSGGDQVYEGGVKCADGAIRDVIFHKAVLYTPEHKVNGIVGVMIDITERNKIESMMIESESRYRSLFENNKSVMLIIDPSEGGIVDANDAAVKYYGWSRDELRSMNINQINTLDSEEINKEMERVKGADKNIFKFRHRHSDGSISDVESYSGLIVLNEREYLYSIIHDISDRIKAETELRKAVDEKGALLQELQHRVKNNLAMISGLIGLETIRSGDNKVIAVLKNLRSRIGALERLYSSLYHTGNVKEIRLDTYVSEIADSIIKTYISELQNIKIVTDFEPFVVSIKHAASIGLIANELLVNALKYAFPDGREGVITVTLKVSGPGYELAVTDNGIGLPQGFDVKDSTGSGIMIIDMLAEHMEGAFNFEAGEFTSFKVTVPFIE